MRNAMAQPLMWLGRYPERVDDARTAADRQLWRSLGAPLWSQRLALRQARAFLRRVEAPAAALARSSDAELANSVRSIRRAFSTRGLAPELCAQGLAIVAEAAFRSLGLRPHAVQMLGAWTLLRGRLAEMDTGEGKTLTIGIAAATAALAHQRTHVITVNDYLVERDARTMAPLYTALGLRVAGITDALREPGERAVAWRHDVVYCCNKGLVFDYLRDRAAMGGRRSPLHRELDVLRGAPPMLLPGLQFGIVDEADSVLIDECSTPFILSRESAPLYDADVFREALGLAASLSADEHFVVDPARRRIELTAAGQARLVELTLPLAAFWRPDRRREELVRQALTAGHFFRRDEHYLVREGKVQIIDPNTGRVMPDRSWELGLQQIIEMREGCRITGGKETLARITFQRFFGRYQRLAAATGTGSEVAGELWRVYGLRVLRIPRHRPSRLQAAAPLVHRSAQPWVEQLVARVRELHAKQRPVLVATRTVAMSEELSRELTSAGLPHLVLNARQDAAEAAVVAKAGEAGRITVATNMAGRGTDIKLGGGVERLGGLHVIATELNVSARLDRQLAGRAGRQGDPGSYEVLLSLDDELVRRHLPGWLRQLAARWLDSGSRAGRRAVLALVRGLQLRLEADAARQRRNALNEDRRIGDALSFSGVME